MSIFFDRSTGATDRIIGLRRGADDYLTKPFAFDALLAPIKSRMRRPPDLALQSVLANCLKVSNPIFDKDKMQISLAGVCIAVTTK